VETRAEGAYGLENVTVALDVANALKLKRMWKVEEGEALFKRGNQVQPEICMTVVTLIAI
jgi:hypothetical protein